MDKKLKKEIEWLLAEKYPQLPVQLSKSGVGSSLAKNAKKDIERLKRGEPLDYVIGFTDFLGCKIDLSKKPMIPRAETEFWVEKEINNLNSSSLSKLQHIKCLDMFSGSGCIGISVIRHLSNVKMFFAEKNKKFIKQIKINCKLNNIDNKKYKIIQSDIFKLKTFRHSAECRNVFGKFDYIFANPPYIPTLNKNKIQKSVLKHEPHLALFGRKDGMFYINKFLAEAKNFLIPKGMIFMEFDPPQKNKIESIIKKNGYEKWQFHKDQYEKWRWVQVSL